MIEKIDIQQFGIFNNYYWDKSSLKGEKFKKINIIYGRNYSGKTTISRIFSSLEYKTLPKNYKNSEFSVAFKDSVIVTQANLNTLSSSYFIAVYNSDFIKNYLGWHRDDGEIAPFTVLGDKNNELDKAIQEIDQKLGSVDGKVGLRFKESQKSKEYKDIEQNVRNLERKLEDGLKDKANNDISCNPYLFKKSTNFKIYTKVNLKKGIKHLLDTNTAATAIVSPELEENLKHSLTNPIKTIDPYHNVKLKFNSYIDETNSLLAKTIKPSATIEDLMNNSSLSKWVEQGINLHKGKRDTCGFCQNIISANLWAQLDAHFNEEFNRYSQSLEFKIKELENSKQSHLLEMYTSLEKNIHSNLKDEINTQLKLVDELIKKYDAEVDKLIGSIKYRKDNVFSLEIVYPQVVDYSHEIDEATRSINSLIQQHNDMVNNIAIDHEEIRKRLRVSEVAKFILETNYIKQMEAIAVQNKLLKELADEKDKLKEDIEALESQRKFFEDQMQDEKKAADLVNNYLSQHFGHNELTLEALGAIPNIKFEIYRHGIKATNLSEGECSLISFCYFMAKLQDRLNSTQKPIIYIDDPICSLDNNHIFFIFSLIDSLIARTENYQQLFISTHNLEFLKYLKRLTGKDLSNKQTSAMFLVERQNNTNSRIRILPHYMRSYITEFTYLFEHIYLCANPSLVTDPNEYIYYNFGNNLRKFLEYYLYYKYPNHLKQGLFERMERFFGRQEAIKIPGLNRLINEYSHTEEYPDKVHYPIEVPEMQEIAKYVLEILQEKDPEQYSDLEACIGLNP